MHANRRQTRDRRSSGLLAGPTRLSLLLGAASALLATPAPAPAQNPKNANYDEAKVPSYSLPDPLALSTGARVRDARAWVEARRPEVLGLFETQVYGKMPGRPLRLAFEVTRVVEDALGGKAT